MNLETGTRIVWAAGYLVGVFFIARCWRSERCGFYLLFAASWGLRAVHASAELLFAHVAPVRWILAFVVAPASIALGVAGFARLSRYLRRRIITVRTDAAGNYTVRPFLDTDDRDTWRPPKLS